MKNEWFLSIFMVRIHGHVSWSIYHRKSALEFYFSRKLFKRCLMIISQHRKISIKLRKEKPYIFHRVIKRINHMSFCCKQNYIFYLLCFWIDFQDISRKSSPRISFRSNDKLFRIYSHFDDLVIDGRIIEISSQQKENQYSSHDIVVEDRQQKYAGKNNSENKIPHLASLKFFSIINKNTHPKRIKDKTRIYCNMFD